MTQGEVLSCIVRSGNWREPKMGEGHFKRVALAGVLIFVGACLVAVAASFLGTGSASHLPHVAPMARFLDTAAETQRPGYVLTSAYSRAAYETTATKVVVTVKAPLHDHYPEFAQVGVYVDGELHQVLSPPTADAFSVAVELPAGRKRLEFVGGPQSAPSQSFPPLGVFYVSASANAPMVVVDEFPTNRLLIYGDSIAVGANAEFPGSQGWGALIRKARSPDSTAFEAFGYRSLFMDGSTPAKRAEFVAKVAAYQPATLWLAIGTNDYGLSKWSASDFAAAYSALLDDLHRSLPSTAIYCQTPLVRAREAANAHGSTLEDYRNAIVRACSARSPYARVVDGSKILTTSDLVDGVHPTTAGHAIYATYVQSELGIP